MDAAVEQIRKIVDNQVALEIFADEKFDKTDQDGNGTIELDELKVAMIEISEEMGLDEPSDDVIVQTFNKFDKDKSQALDKDEFRLFIKNVLQTFLIAFDDD